MPHVVVEYSANIEQLDRPKLLKRINQVLIESKLFQPNDIKARLYCNEDFLIGEGDSSQAYIYVEFSLFNGRTNEQKQRVREALMHVLTQQDYYKTDNDLQIQLCVQLLEMNKENYLKQIVNC